MAKRSPPGAFGYDGPISSMRKMADAENDNSLRQRYARVNCACYVAGITVAGMRDQAGADGQRRRVVFSAHKLLNLSDEFAGIVRIKRTGNSGSTNHNRLEISWAWRVCP